RLRRVIELVAVVIEAAYERVDRAVSRRYGNECGLGLRQRCDRVAPLFVTNDTNYGTSADPLRGRRLVGKRARDELQSFAARLDLVAVAQHRAHLVRARLQHDG